MWKASRMSKYKWSEDEGVSHPRVSVATTEWQGRNGRPTRVCAKVMCNRDAILANAHLGRVVQRWAESCVLADVMRSNVKRVCAPQWADESKASGEVLLVSAFGVTGALCSDWASQARQGAGGQLVVGVDQELVVARGIMGILIDRSEVNEGQGIQH